MGAEALRQREGAPASAWAEGPLHAAPLAVSAIPLHAWILSPVPGAIWKVLGALAPPNPQVLSKHKFMKATTCGPAPWPVLEPVGSLPASE